MAEARCDITIPNSVDSLGMVMTAIPEFASKHGLPEACRRAAMLVVEELTTNIINYGYDEGKKDEIDIHLAKLDEELEITIRDGANPFNVEDIEHGQREDLSLDDMAVGGLGLFLVHQFASSIKYSKVGNHNQTIILLPLQSGDI